MKTSTKLKITFISLYSTIFFAVPVVLSMISGGAIEHEKYLFYTMIYAVGLTIGAFLIEPVANKDVENE